MHTIECHHSSMVSVSSAFLVLSLNPHPPTLSPGWPQTSLITTAIPGTTRPRWPWALPPDQIPAPTHSQLRASSMLPYASPLILCCQTCSQQKDKRTCQKTIIFPPPWIKCPFKTQTYNIQNRSQNYTCNISFKLFTEGITVAFIKIFSCFFPNEIHILSSSSLFCHCFQKFTVFQVP